MSRMKELWQDKYEEAEVELGYSHDDAVEYANSALSDMTAALEYQAEAMADADIVDYN